jgi:hypothetical protein
VQARLPGVHIGVGVRRPGSAPQPFRAPEAVPSEGSEHLVERQVRASPLVVFEIQPQDAAAGRFMQDDDAVQALAANRADQALDVGILPRRSRSGEDFADAQPPCRFVEFLSAERADVGGQISACGAARVCRTCRAEENSEGMIDAHGSAGKVSSSCRPKTTARAA